jgi:serine/threonine-protein kinase
LDRVAGTDPLIGRVIDDRYSIVRLLGRGGMGAVYEARHTGTGRRVAIKVILGDQLGDSQLARFQREALAVGAVESQYIAQIFDTGRDRTNGAPFIAMELLDGEDVRSLVERLGPLPVDLSLRIVLQACLGLDRAHRAGIIHRDIKSANLFLARQDGRRRIVKLLDFGVAKVVEPGLAGGGLTQTGVLLGSPLYMSPEQARGSGAIDARSDLWSLGITLYECLSGRRPNEGAQGLGELIMTICTTPATSIQDVAPWVPPEVAQVVHWALAIQPGARCQSAADLAAALGALLPHGYEIDEGMLAPLSATTRAYVAPRAARLEQSAVGATSFGVTNSPRRPSGGSRAALIVGGALAAAAAGGLGVYLAVRPGEVPTPVSAAPVEATSVSAAPAPGEAPRVEPTPTATESAGIAPPAASSVTSPAASSSALPAATSASRPAGGGQPQTGGARPAETTTKQPTQGPRPPRSDDDETSRK